MLTSRFSMPVSGLSVEGGVAASRRGRGVTTSRRTGNRLEHRLLQQSDQEEGLMNPARLDATAAGWPTASRM